MMHRAHGHTASVQDNQENYPAAGGTRQA